MVHLTKTVACALALIAGGAFAATWTGSEDGFWTNRNNWAEKTVPGSYLDASGAKAGSVGDTVVFPAALDGEKVTEINLDGLVSIGTVLVSGGAALPTYVFGDASGEQVLAIEQSGAFSVVDADATVPTLRCRLGICASRELGNTPALGNYSAVTNNSSATLHLGQFGFWSSFPTVTGTLYFDLCGTGDVQFDGSFVGSANTISLYLVNGRTIVATDLDPERKHIAKVRAGQSAIGTSVQPVSGTRYIEITEGAVLPISAAGSTRSLDIVYNTEFCGKGLLLMSCGQFTVESPLTLMHGNLTFSCKIDVAENAYNAKNIKGGLSDMWLNGRPEYPYSFRNVFVTGENMTTGMVTAIGNNSVAGRSSTWPSVQVDRIGKAGESGRLGTGSAIRLGNGTRLVYTGAGEETDRTVILTNGTDTAVGVLEHNGSGVFEWSGVVSQQWQEVTLALGGTSAAGAVFSGVLAENPMHDYVNPVLNLEKRDAGTWTLTAANTYVGSTTVKAGTLAIGPSGSIANSSGVILAGGELVFENAPTARTETLANVTLSAPATVRLGKNRSLTLAEMPTRSNAETLDVRTSDYDSILKVDGATAGLAPGWLTVNGEAAAFDADGVLNQAGLTRWSKGEDGDWSETDAWSDGVPIVEKIAYVGADSVSIDVTGATAGRLFLNGAETRLEIPSGSSYVAEHATAVPVDVPDADAIKKDTFVVADGAMLSVAGGTLSLTNATGLATVRSDDVAVTSRIEVTDGGTLFYAPTAGRGRMTIGVGGELTATDATVTSLAQSGMDVGLQANGGRMTFDGNSTFGISNPSKVSIRAFGSGETRFAGTSTFDFANGAAFIAAEKAGETAILSFTGSSGLKNKTRLFVGGTAGSLAKLVLDTDQGLMLDYFQAVGTFYGAGEMDILRGDHQIDNVGLSVGGCTSKTVTGSTGTALTGAAATGTVYQAGGTLTIFGYGALSGYGWDDGQPIGLILGAGTATKNTTHGNVFSGRYEISDGTLELRVGHGLIGAGYATGAFVQTGGTVKFNAVSYKLSHDTDGDGVADYTISTTNLATVVGLAGGEGSLIISNGSFRAASMVYVGGASTNIFMHMPIYSSGKWSTASKRFTNYPFDRRGATGVLTVAGGTVTFGQSLVLGADGTGTFEVVGTNGTVSIADSLILSNSTQSVVRFVAGEKSVTPVKVGGKLVVQPGARLEVDASALTKSSLRLFKFGEMEGAFDPADITVVGQKIPGDCELQTRGDELWMKLPGKGMMLILR